MQFSTKCYTTLCKLVDPVCHTKSHFRYLKNAIARKGINIIQIQIRFEAERGATYFGDIALDDIYFTEEKCPQLAGRLK